MEIHRREGAPLSNKRSARMPAIAVLGLGVRSWRPSIRAFATSLTPGLAKRIGGEVQLREDWTDQVKKDVMLKIQEAKYTQHVDLGEMLLATNDEEIIEGNWHGDSFWGYDLKTSFGQNWLGRLIMIVRAELKFRRELQELVEQMRMKMRVNCTFVSEEPLSSFR